MRQKVARRRGTSSAMLVRSGSHLACRRAGHPARRSWLRRFRIRGHSRAAGCRPLRQARCLPLHSERHVHCQSPQPVCRSRHGLLDGGQVSQRTDMGEMAACLIAPGKHTRKSDTGNPQLPAAPRYLARALAHERRAINSPLPRDDQVRLAQTLLESTQASKQLKTGFEPCAQKSLQAETKPTRGAGARQLCQVLSELLPHDPRQPAQAALSRRKVWWAQSFLRPIDASRPAPA